MHKIIALYQFCEIRNPRKLQMILKKELKNLQILCTIIIGHEGINGTVSGSETNINKALKFLKSDSRFSDLDIKPSFSNKAPFLRLKVKIKKEIVTMGIDNIKPATQAGKYLSYDQWNSLLNDEDTILIDTRNDYEFKIGHYKNAINPKIETFKDFKNYIKNNKEKFQNKKVGIYCTGGIRCEKAGPLMEKYGIETYQLKGGILKYFETTSADSWKGECFVFDYRVSLNKQLSQGTSKLCYGCNMPLTPRERKSPKYEEGYSCSICFDNMTEKKRRSLKDKREHWKKVL